MMLSMESRLNSSGTSSQDSQRCKLCGKINDLLSDLGQTPETFTGRILFMSMFNDISCDRKGNKEGMFGKCRSRQSTCKEDLVLDNGHLLDQVLKRSGILQRIVHKELGKAVDTLRCR